MTRQIFATGALTLGVTCLALVSGPLGAAAQNDGSRRGHDFNISINTEGGRLTTCDQIEATVRNGFLARGEETIAVPQAGTDVRISGPRNGGLVVRGDSRSDYQVVLCKFAAAESMADAAVRLEQVKLAVQDGRVTTTGPDGGGWTAHMLAFVPPDAQLTVDAQNGPLSIEGTSGRLVARAENGPLSVRNCSGQVQANAQNGPLSISHATGSVRATARNGPMSVELSGSTWEGEGLDAQVDNGPLSLRLPKGYESGVVVNLHHNSPVSCRSSACAGAVGSLDDRSPRTLQFGSTTPVVRITARNGPVAIR